MNKTIANRFELHDLFGRGGMGEVYRAMDTQTGETVAVKALNPEVLANDPKLLERFVREGEALRQLDHPNIVHMVAAVEEEGRHYLVMEYVEGGSLKYVLSAENKLSAGRVIEICLDLADALTRAHRLGIIHRDLKPANVLLARDGTPRLADFGIAHFENDQQLTRTGVLLGTVDYLSPEVCQGGVPGEQSDIWAFGVMLFQMLVGKLPFEGQNLTAKITAILTHPVPDLTQLAPDTPDALSDLVYRMLEKDPLQRIPSVRLVGAELEAMLKGREPVTPSRASKEESRFETPTPSPEKAKHNLPVQSTPFVGREAELVELDRLLADPGVRLLSIVGVGGMGKTRLALECGARQMDGFQHGVIFVSLVPLESVDLVVSTIAQSIGFAFHEGSEPRQQLLDHLREKHMLLILDNFEHLLEAVSLAGEILQNAAKVKVVATSRVKLNVQNEHIFHLEGMDFPDWETPTDAMDYSAVKLFVQSARRAKPGFELAADDLKYVARICRLVGGMPLGILLAAAWVEMLSLPEIAKEIGQHIDFLETSLRDVPERQRSMQAVFDYAWKSLTEREREVLRGLSVFSGGFTRDAAQQVTGASLRDLMGLVDKSLLYRAPTGRYSMHELLRQYAQGKLFKTDEEKIIRGRHLEYHLALAEQFDREWSSAGQAGWMQRIGVEIENIRAALAWSIAADLAEIGLHLVLRLLWFWRSTVYSREGREWLEQLLIEAPQPSADRVNALRRLANLAEDAGDEMKGIELRGEALAAAEALGDPAVIAEMSSSLAVKVFGIGELVRAQQLVERSLDLCRGRSGLQERAAFCTMLMGELAHAAGDQARARDLHEQGLDLYRTMNEPKEAAWGFMDLGIQVRMKGDPARACLLHEKSVALWRTLDDPMVLGVALDNLGSALVALGELERAQEILIESLLLLAEQRSGVADWPLQDLGILAYAWHQPLRAVRLLGAEDALRRPTGRGIHRSWKNNYENAISLLRSQLGEAAFMAAWNEGAAMTLEQAVELARSGK
jgi:serine/threonine protein kinase/predicted ATPase